jgi:predicted O-methyltransferase YrrM
MEGTELPVHHVSPPPRLSYPQRAAVAFGLTRQALAHPTAMLTVAELFRRQSPAEPSSVPWWNKRATQYLAAALRPGDRVFEWGSGASTIWLAGQGASVTSIEHKAEWVQHVLDRCPDADIRAVPWADHGVIRSEPQIGDSGRHFFDDYVAAIDAFDDGTFDVIIVDGVCRMECTRRAAPKVKPGGLLIVDDTDFPWVAPHTLLPGWSRVTRIGFKPPIEIRETSFFRKPA